MSRDLGVWCAVLERRRNETGAAAAAHDGRWTLAAVVPAVHMAVAEPAAAAGEANRASAVAEAEASLRNWAAITEEEEWNSLRRATITLVEEAAAAPPLSRCQKN